MPKYESDKDIIVVYAKRPETLRFEIDEARSTRWFELTYEEAAFLYNRIGQKLEELEAIHEKSFNHIP